MDLSDSIGSFHEHRSRVPGSADTLAVDSFVEVAPNEQSVSSRS